MKRLWILIIIIYGCGFFLIADRKNDLEYLEAIAESKPKVAIQLGQDLLKSELSPLDSARALNALAFAHYMVNDFESVLNYTQRAEDLSRNNNFAEQLAYAYYHRGSALWRTGDYANAYDFCTKALRIFEDLGNLRGKLYSANRISTILFELNNFNKAQEFSDLCLKIAQELKITELYARMLSNRSYMHYRLKDYKNMLHYALLAIQNYQSIAENNFIRHAMINAGVANLEMGNYKEAENYLKKAIPICQHSGDRLIELICWKFLARTHKNLKQYALALAEANRALEIARQVNSLFEIKNIQFELAEIYSALGNYQQAYKYLSEATKLLEELQSSEINEKIARTLKQYEIEKRENEIKLLQQEKTIVDLNLRQQRNIKNFLIILALILCLATFLTLRAYVARRKAHQVIIAKNAELQTIDRIVKDINKETELSDLINSIFKHTLTLLPQTQKGGFLYYFEESDLFRPVVYYGYSQQDVEKIEFTPLEAKLRYRENADVVAEGIYLLCNPASLFGSERLREYVLLPKVILVMELDVEGKTLGYLLFENMENPAAFNNSDVERLIRIREHLISALVKTHYITRLEEASRTDPLTSLLNRRGMIEKLQEEIERFNRYKHPFAIAIGDLDDFKKINDTFGHECGDLALVTTAGILRNKLRRVDLVGRWGGEEFLILLPQTSENSALIAVNKVREEILRNPLQYRQSDVRLSMTFGISEFASGRTLDDCLVQADNALYYGKTIGKNRVITFSDLKRKPG